jgi:hypothetical protein
MTDFLLPCRQMTKVGVNIMSLSLRMILFLAAILMVLVTESLVAGRVSRAADDCITKPNAAPPQGNHWYYRTDRTTQRQCWYLRPESETVRAGVQQPTAAAPSAPKPVSTPAPQTLEAAAAEISVIETKAAEEDAPVAVQSIEPSGLRKPNQSIGNGVLINERIADEALIKTSLSDVATTERPAEYEITFVNLALFALVMVFIAIIVRTIFRLSAVRKSRRNKMQHRSEPSLGDYVESPSLNMGEHVEPDLSNSDAVSRRDIAQSKMGPMTPPLQNTADELETTVRLLLRELQLRQHHPDHFQRTSRKVTAAGK